jgi:hypothetical protein
LGYNLKYLPCNTNPTTRKFAVKGSLGFRTWRRVCLRLGIECKCFIGWTHQVIANIKSLIMRGGHKEFNDSNRMTKLLTQKHMSWFPP